MKYLCINIQFKDVNIILFYKKYVFKNMIHVIKPSENNPQVLGCIECEDKFVLFRVYANRGFFFNLWYSNVLSAP